MSNHWPSVIRPLLAALMARVVVEVGVAFASTTKRLLGWTAELGGVTHAIDPNPARPDQIVELGKQFGEAFVFHEATSLEALPEIRDPDVVLLDGDHNWYTAFGELKALERVAIEEGRPFPLTLLHDVDWPYAHRDMYYAPDSIPAEYRNEFAQGGLVPGLKGLVRNGGLNAEHNNALVEGTPRNGVRTAIDDFLAETEFSLRFESVPGFFGMAIIADETLIERTPALGETLDHFHSAEFFEEQCRLIEQGRIDALMRLQMKGRELRSVQEEMKARSEAPGDIPRR